MFELTSRDIYRFWSKVDRRRSNQCWPWIGGSKHRFGYGIFRLKAGYQTTASRIACFLEHGSPPEDKPHAIHNCDNPVCCNPAHLRWGSPKDNTADAIDHGRHSPPPRNASYRTPNPRRGEASTQAKLADDLVRESWRLHFDGKKATEIAEAVGRSVAVVYDVARGRSWRHLSGAPS